MADFPVQDMSDVNIKSVEANPKLPAEENTDMHLPRENGSIREENNFKEVTVKVEVTEDDTSFFDACKNNDTSRFAVDTNIEDNFLQVGNLNTKENSEYTVNQYEVVTVKMEVEHDEMSCSDADHNNELTGLSFDSNMKTRVHEEVSSGTGGIQFKTNKKNSKSEKLRNGVTRKRKLKENGKDEAVNSEKKKGNLTTKKKKENLTIKKKKEVLTAKRKRGTRKKKVILSIKNETDSPATEDKKEKKVAKKKKENIATKNKTENNLATKTEKENLTTTQQQSADDKSSQSTLENPVKRKKSKKRKAKVYTCAECGETFTCYADHIKHRYDVHKRYKCTYENCSKTFKDRADRNKHEDAVHRNIRKFQCHVCAVMFKTSSSLKSHMYYVHTDEEDKKQYKCEVCGKVFFKLISLEAHRSLHTGEKAFKCELDDCDKAFRYVLEI